MHVIIFLLILAGLIIVHEFGHFSVAKMVGMRVEEFAIGFPPRLFFVRRGGTVYSFNLIFVGGFVRILGEQEDESEAAQPQPGSFSSRPRIAQALVVIAGVAANMLAAWILLSSAYLIGMPTGVDDSNRAHVRDVHVIIADVVPKSPAARAGLQSGDRLVSIETGTAQLATSSTSAQASDFIRTQGTSAVVTVTRGGKEHMFVVVPQTGVIVAEPDRKAIGVDFVDVGSVRYPLSQAVVQGALLTAHETATTARGLFGFFGGFFMGRPDLADVSGPVGIVKAGASAAEDGPGMLMLFAALVSINLAFINLLPIPGLDGGRLLFIIIEAMRGKPLPRRWYERGAMLGFTLLALLMLVVTLHDVLS